MGLSGKEIEDTLGAHPEWRLEHGKLVRTWTFPDFAASMRFVNRVAAIAEEADHHPDIDIRYNRVELGLISHDAAGITRRDVAMVARIDADSGTQQRSGIPA